MRIAITGATGFLGLRLVRELLGQHRSLTVLARRGAAGTLDFIGRFLASAGQPPGLIAELPERITVYRADLTQPRFGMSVAEFAELADDLDVLWHSAADTTLFGNPAALRAVNVGGVRNALALAEAGRRRPMLYHVSTAFVAGGRHHGTVYDDELTDACGFETPYERSKYEAELLVRDWQRRTGRPVVVFRPSILATDRPGDPDLPHPLTDAARSLNAVRQNAALAGLRLGSRPTVRLAGNPDALLNFIPVDDAASIMVQLAGLQPANRVDTYHVVHPREVAAVLMTRAIGEAIGMDISVVRELADPDPLEARMNMLLSVTSHLRHQRRYDDARVRALIPHPPAGDPIDLRYLRGGLALIASAPARAGPMTAAASGQEPAPAGWRQGAEPPASSLVQITSCLRRIREPVHIVADRPGSGRRAVIGGEIGPGQGDCQLIGTLPAIYPEWLGDRGFCEAHGVRFPYAAGEMANGIATTRMVAALARAGLLGFFGAAGLDPAAVEKAAAELSAMLPGRPNWGVNLIHSPNDQALEERVADVLLSGKVPAVSASAYMMLTPAVVRCAATGLTVDRAGRIVRPVRVFAKVSRPEVAGMFLSPAPAGLLAALVARGQLTEDEARLAARVPVAEDVTVEADSGGHTDNRPLSAVLPLILAMRDTIGARQRYPRPVRVGAAGGLGSPHAVAAAFALGAAYVVTGSVNQLAVESGISEDARALLAQADVADVTMAPAADMFEQGVRVQVLSRGTMFARRANRLYEAYRTYPSLAAIPADERAAIEGGILHATLGETWAQTRNFWLAREPEQVARAEQDPRHQMALTFRWYLGKATRWAIDGEVSRRADYQLWAGPAVGAFNRWTSGSFLEAPGERTVTQIALNLMEGAAVITRAQQARSHGVPVPAEAFAFTPRRLTPLSG